MLAHPPPSPADGKRDSMFFSTKRRSIRKGKVKEATKETTMKDSQHNGATQEGKKPITLLEIPQHRGTRRAHRPTTYTPPPVSSESMNMILSVDRYENLYQVDRLRNRPPRNRRKKTDTSSSQWTNSIRLERPSSHNRVMTHSALISPHSLLRQQLMFTGFVSSVLAVQAFGIIWMMTQ